MTLSSSLFKRCTVFVFELQLSKHRDVIVPNLYQDGIQTVDVQTPCSHDSDFVNNGWKYILAFPFSDLF